MGSLLPRVSTRWIMAAVAVVALALYDARLTTFLLITIGGGLAFRSLRAGPNDPRFRRWAFPYLVSVACLYLPFAWVLGDFPWDGYRLGWIMLWPVLPGLLAGAFVHPNDAMMALVAGTTSILLVGLLTRLGMRGPRALVAANGIALVGASLESWVAYHLFLM